MFDLLLNKVMNIFLHNSAYERNGFKMWVCILKKYDPRGKDALFESVSALFTLEKTQDGSIRNYTSRVYSIVRYKYDIGLYRH